MACHWEIVPSVHQQQVQLNLAPGIFQLILCAIWVLVTRVIAQNCLRLRRVSHLQFHLLWVILIAVWLAIQIVESFGFAARGLAPLLQIHPF